MVGDLQRLLDLGASGLEGQGEIALSTTTATAATAATGRPRRRDEQQEEKSCQRSFFHG